MEENVKNSSKNYQQHTALTVLGIFALVIIFICGALFIFNYNLAYDDDSGAAWLSPRVAFIIWQYILAILFIFAAIVLKIFLKKRVRL